EATARWLERINADATSSLRERLEGFGGDPHPPRGYRLRLLRGVPPRRNSRRRRGRGSASEGLGLDDRPRGLQAPRIRRRPLWDGLWRGLQPRRPAAGG